MTESAAHNGRELRALAAWDAARPRTPDAIQAAAGCMAGAQATLDEVLAALDRQAKENQQLRGAIADLKKHIDALTREAAAAPARVSGARASGEVAQTDAGPSTSSDSTLDDCAAQLLQDLESAHAADVRSGMSPSTVVDRLALNLDEARGTYLGSATTHGIDDGRAFDQKLDTFIDLYGSTLFGRHLAVAAYAAQQRAVSAPIITALAS